MIATEDASDVAYTTDELLPHSDQNFFESAPGVQILFCIKLERQTRRDMNPPFP